METKYIKFKTLNFFKKYFGNKDDGSLSKDWMLTTLINLGFTESEVQVYVFLVTEGPKKARDIADTLKIQKNQLYCILKKLRSQGIVNSSSEYPARFSVILFDQILDLIIKTKVEQQEALEASKQELLSAWRFITKKESADNC